MRIQLSIKLNISFLRSFGERAEFDPVCVCHQLLQRATDCALELQYTLLKYSLYLDILDNLILSVWILFYLDILENLIFSVQIFFLSWYSHTVCMRHYLLQWATDCAFELGYFLIGFSFYCDIRDNLIYSFTLIFLIIWYLCVWILVLFWYSW